ncbi:MAG TPA: glycosyltransferase family 39 protein [Bryobacteraceae bacterium]|nr:glycosyltransferase family 39 protein [Bryobacteraceae bacterium]
METLEKPITAKPGWSLEGRAAALERFLERHQTLVLALWSLAYFAGTALRALGKPFWYDEILTLLEARQPSLSASLHALGDVDWMPPASHVVFYLTDKLAGHGEIAFRIPVMIAFWIFCLCLFFFARRRVSFYFASMALLLPYASAFQSYSYEARSYAFVLAFCGIALVSWQAAAERTRRAWPLVGLALGIAGAISFQYWGVLIGLPLAAAEAYRDYHRRRIDWPIWIAFALGATPLAAFVFVILRGLRSWTPYAELRATPFDYLDFYRTEFRVYFAFAIPAALLLAAWFVLGGRKEKPSGNEPARIPVHEWIAAAILLLTPVAAVSLELAIPPHAFSNRYAAPAVAGYALLGSFLAARWAGKRAAVGLACALAALAPFAYLMTQPEHFKSPFQRLPGLEQRLERGPVVMDDLIGYLEIWYYTRERLKPSLIFVKAARKQTFPLREFAKLGVPVIAYRDFAAPGKEFLFYPSRRGGLRKRILEDGGTLETVESSAHHSLLKAHIAP